MIFSKAAKLLSLFPKSQSVVIIGPPGIGKTALAKQLGVLTKADRVVVRDLASHLPEDLLGNPFRDGKVTVHAPPKWLYELSSEYEADHVPNLKGILVLDDLGAAPSAMQTAVYRLMQEREVGSTKLASGVSVYATTNRPKDKSGASLLPAALRNKVFLLELEADLIEWSEWAAENGVDSRVIDFLNLKPDLFSKLASDADSLGAFPTPRSWTHLGKLLSVFNSKDIPLEFFRGFVGQGAASEIQSYLELVILVPKPFDILLDPLKALPKPPQRTDLLVTIINTLGHYAAKSCDPKMPQLFIRALLHVTQEHNEFASVGLTSYVNYGGKIESIGQVVKSSAKDPKMKALVKHLEKSKTTAGKND